MDRVRFEELDDEQLKHIEDFSSAFLSSEELAVIFGLDEAEVRQAMQSDCVFRRAVIKGRLQTKYLVRKAVLALAQQGSPQAVVLAQKYIQQAEFKEFFSDENRSDGN